MVGKKKRRQKKSNVKFIHNRGKVQRRRNKRETRQRKLYHTIKENYKTTQQKSEIYIVGLYFSSKGVNVVSCTCRAYKQTDKRVESHRLPPLIESAAIINRTTPYSKRVSSTLDRPSMFATARLSVCV